MAHLLKPISLAALIALAGPAFAQDAEPTEDTAPAADAAPADAAPEADAAPVPGLEMGEPADGAPKQVEQYVDEVIGDWERTCLSIPDYEGPAPCHLAQLLFEEGNENPIGKVSIGMLPEGMQADAAATIYVPLGVLLTQQLVFSVDGNSAKRYPYTACQPIGCFAQFGFTKAEVENLKAGAQGIITVVPLAAPDQTIDIKMSLTGFTGGWNSLERPVQPQAEAAQ